MGWAREVSRWRSLVEVPCGGELVAGRGGHVWVPEGVSSGGAMLRGWAAWLEGVWGCILCPECCRRGVFERIISGGWGVVPD
jgi:hypothetical protein